MYIKSNRKEKVKKKEDMEIKTIKRISQLSSKKRNLFVPVAYNPV